jgi:hypothetical protein
MLSSSFRISTGKVVSGIVTDNGNGAYFVDYRCVTSGQYRLDIYLNNTQQAAGTPINILVHPGMAGMMCLRLITQTCRSREILNLIELRSTDWLIDFFFSPAIPAANTTKVTTPATLPTTGTANTAVTMTVTMFDALGNQHTLGGNHLIVKAYVFLFLLRMMVSYPSLTAHHRTCFCIPTERTTMARTFAAP